jgi:SWI/SNF-related matrix-associated actin-dependent regulator of chromatin subfamily B protein 1
LLRRTAISHAIREQVDIYTRSLCILGYAKGGHVKDDDLRREFLPSVDQSFRTETADEFTPLLNQLTRDEVDRLEKEHDRENRRKRRQTKGRGIVLPDREPARTNRTIVPRSLPDLVTFGVDVKGNKIYHLPELNEPYAIVAKPLPPKPENLTTNDASPLKLLASKDPTGPPRPIVGAAAAQVRRRQQIEAAANGTPIVESPVKAAGGVKKRPVGGRASVEEMGLHEHIVDGLWFCANWCVFLFPCQHLFPPN